jgi:hypothetical protein
MALWSFVGLFGSFFGSSACGQAACEFFSFGKFVLHHFPDNIVQLLPVLAERWILEYSSVTRRYFRFRLLSAKPLHRLRLQLCVLLHGLSSQKSLRACYSAAICSFSAVMVFHHHLSL